MPDDDNGRRPIPDPTLLTTEQLLRSIAGLREVLETRLNGMDKAIELLQSTADKFPARMDEKINAAVGVHEEKFKSIQTQFAERDTRTDGTKRDSKDALDAALAAQKEAVEKQNNAFGLSVAKSEAATDKRIDQMAQLISTTAGGLEGKISDVKDRLTRIEGKGEGTAGARTGTQQNIGVIIAVVMVALTIGGALVAAVMFIAKGG